MPLLLPQRFPRIFRETDRARLTRLWPRLSEREQADWLARLQRWQELDAEVYQGEIELQRKENEWRAERDPRRWAYIAAALKQAVYTPQENGTLLGTIPGLQGVLAQEPTQEACQVELAAGLDSWLTARLRRGLEIPVIAGIDLNPPAPPQPILRSVSA